MSWFKVELPADPFHPESVRFNYVFSRLYREGNRYLAGKMVYFSEATPDDVSITFYFSPEAFEGLSRFIHSFSPSTCEKPNVNVIQRYQPV
jgi:hypothetical protein